MNRRALNLSEYNLSKAGYYELYWFCRQYPDKKLKASLMIRTGNQALSGMPHCQGVSDSVYSAAISRERLLKDCELVEQAAIEADAELYQAILRNVTLGEPYERIGPPCGRRQFFEKRRIFFYLLQERKNGIPEGHTQGLQS